MHAILLHESNLLNRRRDEGSGGGALGCFAVLMMVGIVLFLVLRGRRDRPEQLAAAKRPLGSGPVEVKAFANPFAKCANCGAAGSKMRQQYDGFRAVTWTCGYCGHAQIQELQDHELPPQVRQRLGLDPQASAGFRQDFDGPMGGSPLGGAGGLLTGMMLGSMMGGGFARGSEPGSGGEEGGWGGADSGSDWGAGGSDSGGDWGDGGGDFGGDGGGDW